MELRNKSCKDVRCIVAAIAYPLRAIAPDASSTSNFSAADNTSLSSSSSSLHGAVYIPYSSLVSNQKKYVLDISHFLDESNFNVECMRAIEMAEKAYFDKKGMGSKDILHIFNESDIDRQCMIAIEIAEEAYFEKKVTENKP